MRTLSQPALLSSMFKTAPCATVVRIGKFVPGPDRTLRLLVVTSPLPMGVTGVAAGAEDGNPGGAVVALVVAVFAAEGTEELSAGAGLVSVSVTYCLATKPWVAVPSTDTCSQSKPGSAITSRMDPVLSWLTIS